MEQEGGVVSKLITLDEAIEWGKRGELCDLMTEDDQRQIAEWLRQARGAESAARWYTAKLREVETENATLRQQLADATESMGRVEERFAELRELLSQAIYAMDDADWASIVSTAIALGVEA